MAKTIRFNAMKRDSIDSAVQSLKDYANKLKKAESEIAYRLAKIGMEVVRMEFYNADPIDVDIYITSEGKRYIINASGEEVMFIEFGAGMSTEDYEHPNAEGLPPIAAGSWSATEGSGQYLRKGYWYYERHRYYGYPDIGGTPSAPAHGFYQASKEIKAQAEEIVRKVLSKL